MILDENFKIIVYRGGTEVFPENSIQAIENSLHELPNAIIELDLQITKDNEIVAFHDFQLEDLTNGQGLIAEHTLTEVQRFNLKNADKTISQFKVPKLIDIFTLFPNQCFVLDLHEYNLTLFEKVIAIVEAYSMENKVALVSMAKGAIRQFQKLRPTWTFVASPQETIKFILFNKIGLQIFATTTSKIMFLPNKLGIINILTKDSFKALHKRNIKVWTCNNFKPYENVNGLTDLEDYKQRNIDGIYTDNPKRLK
ncbi:MAG: glycerophosphodiester phosphodiesterase [Flammeovirgaceae bacterium]